MKASVTIRRRGTLRIVLTAHVAGAVRSLVSVRFADCVRPLTYLNDRFDLHEGDVVYVSGRLAAKPGVVETVITKFRIPTGGYERVLSVLDLRIHGTFFRQRDKMVSLRAAACPPEQFASWVRPPQPYGKDSGSIVSGEGYSIDLNDLAACPDITDAVAARAEEYLQSGRVRYLAVQNGTGRAYVEGTRWYRVDFRCSADGLVTRLYCDCPYPALCKHEVAVARTLQMLRAQPQLQSAQEFVALDRTVFQHLATRAEHVTL